MKVLVVNPSRVISINPGMFYSRGISLYPCHSSEDALDLLERYKIDIVVAFLKFSGNHVYPILKTILSKYPGKKVIGLADTGLTAFISFLDHVNLTPVETSVAGI